MRRRLIWSAILMTMLLVGTFGLVSSDSKRQAPSNTVASQGGSQTYNAARTEALRGLYNDPIAFEQMSGAARSRLEMMFGKKNPKQETPTGGTRTLANGNGSKVSNNPVISNEVLPPTLYTGGETIQPLAAPTTVLVNNPAADTTARNTQSETSIALAANGNVIVSWNDSGSLQDPNFNLANDKFTGVGISTNGGTSFTDQGTFPTTSTALQGDSGDPIIAVDRTSGAVYVTTLAFTGAGIQVFKSTNNGSSYNQPTNAFPGFNAADFFDKEWIAVDNATGTGQGNVYVVSRLFSGSANISGIYFSRSTDAGATFTTPVGTPNIVTGQQGAYVTVGPDHSVYVFWYDSSSGRRIRMRKSTDLGVTFGPAINVSPALISTGVNGDLTLAGGFRSNSFPQAVVSQTNANFLYATYNDSTATTGGDRGNIFVVNSTDGGSTWGTAVQINDDGSPTAQQYGPVIAITPDGTKLFSGFYDRRNSTNTTIDVYGAISTINGTTGALTPLGGNFRITEQSFPVVVGVDPVINGTYMGDYDQAVADNSFFYLSWGDNRGGSPDVRFSKISVNGPGAILGFSSAMITADGDNNGAIDINETASFNVTLRNNGTSAAMGVSASLATTTPNVTVTQGTSAYPNISAGGMATNNTPFSIMTNSSFVCGTAINFNLTVTTTSDGTFIIPFSLPSGKLGAPMTFSFTGPPVPINDNAVATASINVSGLTGAIGDINFSFDGSSCSAATGSTTVGLDHTFVSDLQIELMSPDGTNIIIIDNADSSGNNYCNTVLDDSAVNSIQSIVSTQAPFTGTFKPANALSAFNGKMGNGNWTLTVRDQAAGDTGNIRAFSLVITPQVCTGGGGGQQQTTERAFLFVADTTNNRIQRSTNDGTSWSTVGFGAGTGNGFFNRPQGVVSDSAGTNIFVADTGNNRIQRSTNGGLSWTTIATAGVGTNQVNAPQGLAFADTAMRLYVTDTGNNRVLVCMNPLAATPTFAVFAGATAGTALGQFNQPTGIAVDLAGLVYVSDSANNRVQRNMTGATGGWTVFAGLTAGTTLGKVVNPTGIFVDSTGRVYVADTGNNRVQRIMGTTPSLFASPGIAIGTVNGPRGVTATTSGSVFIGDTLNNRVQKVTTGGVSSVVGAPGVATGQFNGPTNVR